MTEERMKEAIEILLQISEDQSVPRNIRRSATKSIEMLNDKSMELAVRAVNAIEELEDSTGDANTPFHTRTMIWQAITKLEIPRDKKEDQKDEYEDEFDDDEWEEWDEKTQSWVIVRKDESLDD
jgi:uncharacterized protein (UPF0147 family)